MKFKTICGYGSVLFALSSSMAFAGNPESFLKNLAGCFEVTFNYFEDGVHNAKVEVLREWIYPVGGSPYILQHVGIAGGHAFKHWREEWRENSDGTLYQKVVGPFEDFRYECSAPLNINQWRCAVKGAPKPRRDQARSYATIDRENTLQVTSLGWVQNENNVKRDTDGTIVSNELGWNTYIRLDESECKSAQKIKSKL